MSTEIKQSTQTEPNITPEVADLSLWTHFLNAMSINKNYANFSGRATRKEYWAVNLFFWLTLIAFGAVVAINLVTVGTGENFDKEGFLQILVAGGILFIGFVLYMTIPMLSVSVRRLHDLGHSGWWLVPIYLLSLLYVGILGKIYIAIAPGKNETNRFGPSPYPSKTVSSPSDGIIIIIGVLIALILGLGLVSQAISGFNSSSSTTQNNLTNTSQHTPKPNNTLQDNFFQNFFQNLPADTPVYALSNVHIRECASKNCNSLGILPKSSTMYVSSDQSHIHYQNGWLFVRYYGSFCFLQNHSNSTGCTWWDNDVSAYGWVYTGNLTTLAN